MKRKDLIKKLSDNGVKFIRDGGEHDIYGRMDADGMVKVAVPRHREIVETTARRILKQFSIEE